MQVILREEVPHLGRRGEVVRVARGYARNYLLPKRLAYVFTEGVRRQVELEARASQAAEVRELEAAQSLAVKLKEIPVVRFTRRVGATGALYGSVTSGDIAAALAEAGVAVDKRQIRLDEPLKRAGTFRVKVHLFRDIEVEAPIEIEAEGAPASS